MKIMTVKSVIALCVLVSAGSLAWADGLADRMSEANPKGPSLGELILQIHEEYGETGAGVEEEEEKEKEKEKGMSTDSTYKKHDDPAKKDKESSNY